MNVRRFLLLVLVLASGMGLWAQSFEVPDTGGTSWFKGNTHAHSIRSVGNVDPLAVAKWYKTNGYQFLVLTDDNTPADARVISEVTDSTFLLIPGMEIKANFRSGWIHVNGLNANSVLYPRQGDTALKTLQGSIDDVRGAGGVPQVDHPHFMSGPDRDLLLKMTNCALIEIFNGYVGPHVADPNGLLATENDWDYLLSAGKRVFGVSADDENTIPGHPGGYGGAPGRGWVVVRAHSLNAAEIFKSLERGLFYSSTGVELTDIRVQPKRIVISIKSHKGVGYTTSFIGENGRVLFSTRRNPAVFRLRGGTSYVRAKVVDTNDHAAWIQPVFVD